MHVRLETILKRGVGCRGSTGGLVRLPLVVLFEWEGGDGTHHTGRQPVYMERFCRMSRVSADGG